MNIGRMTGVVRGPAMHRQTGDAYLAGERGGLRLMNIGRMTGVVVVVGASANWAAARSPCKRDAADTHHGRP
jgi:hypothetical protein